MKQEVCHVLTKNQLNLTNSDLESLNLDFDLFKI